MAAPAKVTPLGTWREQDTTMGPVLDALDRLRQCDPRGAVRTSLLTLLAVGGEGVEIDEVFDTVHRLGMVQPTRVVVVRVLPGEHHRLDARVGVHLQSRGGRDMGIDDVALEVAGPVTSHLDSLVEPLTLPDLPVVVWCRERLPPARSRLIDLADHLVVDTVAAGGRSRLGAVARLHHRTPVVDFAWLRLGPLRRRLASCAPHPEMAPLLDRVTAATAGGPAVERALLAGWLVDRLPAATVTEGGDDAYPFAVLAGNGFRLAVESGAESISVTLARPGQEEWRSEAAGSVPTTESLLAEALLHLTPDPVFTRALARI